MRSHWRAPLIAVLVAWVLIAPTARAEELQIAAAASLREPVLELVGTHEARYPDDRIRVSFGSSSALAMQIRHGAPVDVFLSADATLVDALVEAGRVDPADQFRLAGNRLIVVRARGSELTFASPEDLLQPGLRNFALPAESVPLGRYAREWLTGRGLASRLSSRVIVTEHARATLIAVAKRYADAAIVYASDATSSDAVEIAWSIPADQQPDIRYAIARIDARASDTASNRFIELALGPDGARILEAAGFEPASASAAPERLRP